MLRVETLSAGYGRRDVLEGVDLSVRAGEIVALLGTNGAGKTTVLRAISGLVRPSAGRILWRGAPISGIRAADIVRRGVIQVPGGRGVFPGMTVEDNLRVAGFLHGRDRDLLRAAIDRALATFPGLADRRTQTAGSLSGGEQQMLTFAKALVMEPGILLVDELSLGLAPGVVEDLVGTLRRLNSDGIAILLVDQNVDLALDLASRAYFLERGQVCFSGPAAELQGRDDLLRSVFLRDARQRSG